ncbi:hypothetical protein MTR_1g028410 [Medicago truncatula]|uniref:Uncharacterized protein n=1 Tax=Medicago truncatula TaxID=3880 RepID=A0A072VG74_MEDTR|nr:hypothetical protein MTR_1g028410 [Medicago truncatula]
MVSTSSLFLSSPNSFSPSPMVSYFLWLCLPFTLFPLASFKDSPTSPPSTSRLQSCNSFLHGVETLSLALFRLRKINLSGQSYLNNQSLFHLFKNCNLLEETIVSNRDWRMRVGIENSKFLKDIVVRPQLKSLDLGRNQWYHESRRVNWVNWDKVFKDKEMIMEVENIERSTLVQGPLDERSHLVREYVEHFEGEKCKGFSS